MAGLGICEPLGATAWKGIGGEAAADLANHIPACAPQIALNLPIRYGVRRGVPELSRAFRAISPDRKGCWRTRSSPVPKRS